MSKWSILYTDRMTKIIIITGTSASGKSSVASLLAKSLPGTWALISQDDVRSIVKAGYLSPVNGWDHETQHQWDVSIDICCDLVKRYQKAGINCILEIFAPARDFKTWEISWKPKLEGLHYQLFVLLPDIETVATRHKSRSGTMTEARIRENYRLFANWNGNSATVIDSSDQTLEETVNLIKVNT